jgi:hypothetical protein
MERAITCVVAWNGNICMHAHAAQHAFHGLRTLFRHNTRAGTLQPATSCCPTTARSADSCVKSTASLSGCTPHPGPSQGTMFRSAAGALLRATRQTAKGSNYVTVVSSSAKQATAQPSPVALPSLNFVRGFAAAAEPAPVASSAEGTVV